MSGHGLSEAEAAQSGREFGDNSLPRPKSKGFWRCFLANLGDPIIKILLAALVVNLILSIRCGNPAECVGIAAAVFISAFVSTVSEYGSEKAFDKLQRESENVPVTVMRDGRRKDIRLRDVVRGDLALLTVGCVVPADGIVIDGEIRCDQSTLNGESGDKTKRPGDVPFSRSLGQINCVFRGCPVTSGDAMMLVCRVGVDTIAGEASGDDVENRASPLKLRLEKLARQLSRLGYAAAILVVAADIAHLLTSGAASLSPQALTADIFHALTLGITVVVVAVPEGLPMMITVVLSSNMLRMLRDNVMVRRLVGIETAGSVDILFTDKTGTLTKGKLEGCGLILPDGSFARSLKSVSDRRLREYAALCLSVSDSKKPNATSLAAKKFAGKLVNTASYEIVARLPFSSDNKYSSVTLSGRGLHGVSFIRGAPELLLPKCSKILSDNGCESYSPDAFFRAEYQKRASEACRMLALCVSFDGEKELALLGVLCIRDELRKEAPGSVKTLQNAGIQVVMITGDSKETAEAIARECGICSEDPQRREILSSRQLSEIDDAELDRLLPELRVVCRALPSDKSRLVRAAEASGRVCAMTGDGVNDAPALKSADVGFAMGSGSEAAREAGDIVILDDNISSIVKAVLYGRTIFRSIRKFIVFQLTMNLSAVGISVIAPLFGIDTPVTVIQMLWVNIIMDTLAGIAFAGEAPRSEYLREPPTGRSEMIVNGEMALKIAVGALWNVVLGTLFLTLPHFRNAVRPSDGDTVLMSAFFALFVFSGVFGSFTSRTDRLNLLAHMNKSRIFTAVMLCVSAVQILLINFGGELFRCAPLTLSEWRLVIVCASGILWVDFIRKLVMRGLGRRAIY